jgi:branched-chain amino acid transport system permease protein
MDLRRYIPVCALLGFMILVQLGVTMTGATYYLTQLTMSAYYALVVMGLCLLMGFAGQISLGHAGFFAIGGYTAAVLTTHDLSALADLSPFRVLRFLSLLVDREDLLGNHVLTVAPWAAFVAAVMVTIGIAFLVGVPVLKLRGHYLAMATLGFGLIVYRVVLGTRIFGEADGISGVPPFPLFFGLEVSGDLSRRIGNFYISYVLVAIVAVLSINLIHSRIGRALRSIHGSEEAAEALGVNTARYKLYTFVLSAVFAAVGGVFLTHFNGGIGPSEATVIKSVRYVAIVAVGGMANLWGTLVISIILNFMSLRGIFGSFDDAVFGAILILTMLFAPQGVLKVSSLVGIREELRSFLSRMGRTGTEAGGGPGD